MIRPALTVTTAKNARPEHTEYALHSERVPGLSMRVRPSGAKSFSVLARPAGGGKPVRTTIGRYGVLTVQEAEDRARGILTQLRDGIDPRTAIVEKRAETAKAVVTFAAAGKAYLNAFETATAPSSRRNVPKPSAVKREALSVKTAVDIIGREPVDAIGREHALLLKDALFDKAPSTRKHVWTAAARVLRFAIERGDADVNIFTAMTAPHGSEARTRYLTLDELVKVWRACDQLADPWGDLIRFLVAVPLRFGEAASLTADRVRADGTIDLVDTKTRIDWRAPITGLAGDILARRAINAGLVFPSPGTRTGYGAGSVLTPSTKVKARLDERSGVHGWRLHDLRRSVMHALGDHVPDFDPLAGDRWLGHKLTGITGVYNKSAHLPATRRVAEQWDSLLRQAIA